MGSMSNVSMEALRTVQYVEERLLYHRRKMRLSVIVKTKQCLKLDRTTREERKIVLTGEKGNERGMEKKKLGGRVRDRGDGR
jgi:hypothetical protein